jgi:hypothetical protein
MFSVCRTINELTDRLAGKFLIEMKTITELQQGGPVCDVIGQALTLDQVEDVRVSQQRC